MSAFVIVVALSVDATFDEVAFVDEARDSYEEINRIEILKIISCDQHRKTLAVNVDVPACSDE